MDLFNTEEVKADQLANSKMFIAQFYLDKNDFSKALYGDSTISIDDTAKVFHKGFLEISNDFLKISNDFAYSYAIQILFS